MNLLRLAAPAKVNLGLWVGPKRDDGYHEIVTVIAPLRLHDTVSLRIISESRIGILSHRESGPR
ncbi:4-(cytidine 5'-diphospho)-2-C-methyl-D-erythritol kinase, partial [candidate division WOR-3 bacterium]|nr:4-(cytidine 5'-diphospho)-2-C-methyl-D-erythritol kinase [candidate division WOR-3 bacterium]